MGPVDGRIEYCSVMKLLTSPQYQARNRNVAMVEDVLRYRRRGDPSREQHCTSTVRERRSNQMTLSLSSCAKDQHPSQLSWRLEHVEGTTGCINGGAGPDLSTTSETWEDPQTFQPRLPPTLSIETPSPYF